jgi:predicted phosphoribosyltransferase
MWYEPIFENRRSAGRALAERLKEFSKRDDVIVLALPRGGVPVGAEVARAILAPLDVFVVRKLGVPGHEELAFGAIAAGGVTVFNEGVLSSLRLPQEMLEAVIRNEKAELDRRERLYRGSRETLDVKDKTVVVVDDGLATGATMSAAVDALRNMGAREIVVAVPVSSRQACDEFNALANVRCISATTPEPFYGVGMWYEDFSQTTDREVEELLATAARKGSKTATPGR